jgi:hypothetical protein
MPGLVTSLALGGQTFPQLCSWSQRFGHNAVILARRRRRTRMLPLVIGMAVPLFAVIGYALLQPNHAPAPEGAP